jgi:glucose dehydrogenase
MIPTIGKPDLWSPRAKRSPSKHGGGGPWQPLTYDPELNLIYVATGNPNPVGATQSRNTDSSGLVPNSPALSGAARSRIVRRALGK